jgi:hypothetical protein
VLAGATHDTNASELAGLATTPDGTPGTLPAIGVTAFEAPDTAPAPAEFDAWTLNVYAVPAVKPPTVADVPAGAPVTDVGDCATDPIYGVTV